MSSLRSEDRQDLLRDLEQMGSSGRAEGEELDKLSRTFVPVKEHLRMLDPGTVLVVGPRGSGKTEIFRVLTDTNILDAVVREVDNHRIPPVENMEWMKGFPLGRDGFDARGLRRFINDENEATHEMQELWFAYLVRLLEAQFEEPRGELAGLLNAPGGAPTRVYDAFRAADETPLLALDNLDARLEREGRYIFVAYDELDTLGGDDWGAMAAGVRGLVAFWSSYARRWNRIRPKIFLRTDLFERFAVSGGADLAKLAAGRVELTWSDRQLYSMLLRRIASTSDRLADYVRRVRGNVEWRQDPDLGLLPTLTRWADARPVIDRMVGPYMGSNKKKGLSYRWPLAHIRDGRDRALPRPLVRLFEEAAHIETGNPNPIGGMRILAPVSLRKAIDRVSSEHVAHALDEWKWLDSFKSGVDGLLVPADRRDVERLLAGCGRWDPKPPFENPRDMLDYTIDVGILRQRSDERIDASDLFLYGLGLRRKGGVRRR